MPKNKQKRQLLIARRRRHAANRAARRTVYHVPKDGAGWYGGIGAMLAARAAGLGLFKVTKGE